MLLFHTSKLVQAQAECLLGLSRLETAGKVTHGGKFSKAIRSEVDVFSTDLQRFEPKDVAAVVWICFGRQLGSNLEALILANLRQLLTK